MTFRFRLAPLLRYRKRHEEEQALALAQAARRKDDAVQQLTTVERRLETCRQALTRASLRGTTGTELVLLARTVEAYGQDLQAAERHVAAEHAHFEQALDNLVAAARERRALERLAEVQQAAHARHEDQVAQRELDDVASIHHLWRKRQA